MGKVYFKDDLVYTFDLLPDNGHQMPAFINLQQYYLEHYLVSHLKKMKNVEIRWLNKVTHVSQKDDQVQVDIKTPDGKYQLACNYLIAADGSRS